MKDRKTIAATRGKLRVAALMFLFCFALTGLCLAQEQTASSLNAKGYSFYKEKKYDQAFEYFVKAIEKDATYALAHYNLACTLGILRSQGKICEFGAYKSKIIEHLNLTLNYMPDKKSKMLKDPDLAPAHDTFGWQVIRGLSVDKPKEIATILSKVTWYGPAPGAYGPMSGFDFKANGTFRHWTLDIEHDPVKKVYESGRYTVQGKKITVIFDKLDDEKEPRKYSGTLTSSGVLKLEELNSYTDDPDECSA